MQRQRRSVKIIAFLLAIVMVVTLFGGIFASVFGARARSLTDIDRQINETRGQLNDLESQTSQLQAQMSGLAGTLATLRDQEGGYLEELAILQEQLLLLQEKIELTEAQIALYISLIEDKEERVMEATLREEEQLELYLRRLRSMEERGPVSYLQIFLRAQSFSDLIARIHDAEEIIAFDQRVAEQLERYRVAVQEYKAELLAEQDELEVLVARLEIERADLQAKSAEVEERIREVEAKIEANMIALAELEAEEARIAAEILARAQDLSALSTEREEAIRELERQAQAGGHPGGGGMGGTPARPGTGHFVWPSDFTTNVTSHFGYRARPFGGGSEFHTGIDIAAAGIYGTNVLASASGYVTFSGWSAGFGNFIMIRHGSLGGDIYYTAYAHQSANLVSPGQNVVQGQVIGLVGSTGWSTGPHIHFEIIRNGVRVNPMLYF